MRLGLRWRFFCRPQSPRSRRARTPHGTFVLSRAAVDETGSLVQPIIPTRDDSHKPIDSDPSTSTKTQAYMPGEITMYWASMRICRADHARHRLLMASARLLPSRNDQNLHTSKGEPPASATRRAGVHPLLGGGASWVLRRTSRASLQVCILLLKLGKPRLELKQPRLPFLPLACLVRD